MMATQVQRNWHIKRQPAGTKHGGQFAPKAQADILSLNTKPLSRWELSHPPTIVESQQRCLELTDGDTQKRWSAPQKTATSYQQYDSTLLGKIVYIDAEHNLRQAFEWGGLTRHGATLAFRKQLRKGKSFKSLDLRDAPFGDLHSRMTVMPSDVFEPYTGGRKQWAEEDIISIFPPDYIITNDPESSLICEYIIDSRQSWDASTRKHKPSLAETSAVQMITPQQAIQMKEHDSLLPSSQWQRVRNLVIRNAYRAFCCYPHVSERDMRLFSMLRSENGPSPGYTGFDFPVRPEITNLPHLERVTRQLWGSCNEGWGNAKPGPINGLSFNIHGRLSSMSKKEAQKLIKKYGGRNTTTRFSGNSDLLSAIHVVGPGHTVEGHKDYLFKGHSALFGEDPKLHNCITEQDLIEMLSISEQIN